MALVRVICQEVLGERLFALTVESPVDLRQGFEPGQFLHFRVTDSFDYLLRRPLSLCKADVANNHLTVVYRIQGEGTRRLARLRSGEQVDVLGPLGRGFPLHQGDQRALLVGGGIGVPPLLELARQLVNSGVAVVSVVGYQSQNQAILIDDLSNYSVVHVTSDDGTIGKKGLVTGLLTAELCAFADRYYACGPTPMLQAVKSVMSARGVPGYLSLEERMGCGTGVCVGCVHPIARDGQVKNLKTCREGPVFPAEEVVFS